MSLSFKRGRIFFHRNPKQQHTNEQSRATVWKRRMSSLMLHVRVSAKANCGRKNPLIVPDLCHLRLESSETHKPHSHSHRRGCLQQLGLSNEGLPPQTNANGPCCITICPTFIFKCLCSGQVTIQTFITNAQWFSHRFLDYGLQKHRLLLLISIMTAMWQSSTWKRLTLLRERWQSFPTVWLMQYNGDKDCAEHFLFYRVLLSCEQWSKSFQ